MRYLIGTTDPVYSAFITSCELSLPDNIEQAIGFIGVSRNPER